MAGRHRWAGLALLGVLGCWAALWAQSRPRVEESIQRSPVPQTPAVCPEDCPVDPPTPVVAIRVRVPACAAVGQELEYHICVENCSEAAAHHVIVRNPIPAHARFVRARPEPTSREPELVWQLGTLGPCECREIVLVLSPTGTGDVKDCARVQFEHGQCVCTKIARPSIALRKCGPTQAVINETLAFQLTVSNTGPVKVTNVTITDYLPDGLEHASGKKQMFWEIGTLAPGQCRTVEYQAVARKPGRWCNKAVASAAGGLSESAENCLVVAEARLTLSKTGPAQRYVNLPATYQITVTNAGTLPLANVMLVDPVPPRMTFVSATHGGQLAGSEVRWLVGELPPGQSRTVDVALRATDAGRVCNRATATAERGLSAQAEACTEFVGVSALLLELVDTVDPVEVGNETSYVILVRNQGTTPATGVRVDVQVPDALAVIRVTGPADHRKEGQRIEYFPLTIPPQETLRYTVYAKALRPGDVRCKVELRSDQLTRGAVYEEESTTIYADIPSRLVPEAGPRQK
jgi:uncharacterized repeat protein (TIGR01451 family)